MGTSLWIIGFYIVLVTTFGLSSATHLSPLTPHGRWFQVPDGRISLLRGVNQVNKRPPYDHISLGFDSRHGSFLRSEGFNVVRLGVMWTAVEPTRGRFDLQYLASINETVEMLCQHDIYTLLDLHQDAYGSKTGGAGFPEWASLGQGEGCGVHGFPLCYFRSQATMEDFDNFWANTDNIQDAYMSMLSELATYFSGRESCVIGIELMNEPSPGSSWRECGDPNPQEPVFGYNFSRGCEEFDSDVYTKFIADAVDTVFIANNLINVFYSPSNIAAVGGAIHIGALNTSRGRLGFSYHNYLRMNYSRAFDHADTHQKVNDAALLLSEFGANVNPDFWSEVTELGDQRLSSWIYWAYSNNPPYNFSFTDGALPVDPRQQGLVYDASLPPEGANVDMARVSALARPYLRLVAGTPLTMVYTPPGLDLQQATFSCSWSTAGYDGVSSTSVLYIPPRVFPRGSTISLTGAVMAPGSPSSGVVSVINTPDHSHMVTFEISSPGPETPGSASTRALPPFLLLSVTALLFIRFCSPSVF